jgi:hypothetical protein
MSAKAQTTDHLVCAVLAAQMEALRDRIDTTPVVDLMFRSSDVLTVLSGWIAEAPSGNPCLDQQRAGVLATAAEAQAALEALVFSEAQRQDFARQMADCIITVLERLAAAPSTGQNLSPHELTALYVSEDQLAVHMAVMNRLMAIAPGSASGLSDDATESGVPESGAAEAV